MARCHLFSCVSIVDPPLPDGRRGQPRLQQPPGGHTTRGGQGHLMRRKRVAPHSEMIGAIVLEDGPCCEVPTPPPPPSRQPRHRGLPCPPPAPPCRPTSQPLRLPSPARLPGQPPAASAPPGRRSQPSASCSQRTRSDGPITSLSHCNGSPITHNGRVGVGGGGGGGVWG